MVGADGEWPWLGGQFHPMVFVSNKKQGIAARCQFTLRFHFTGTFLFFYFARLDSTSQASYLATLVLGRTFLSRSVLCGSCFRLRFNKLEVGYEEYVSWSGSHSCCCLVGDWFSGSEAISWRFLWLLRFSSLCSCLRSLSLVHFLRFLRRHRLSTFLWFLWHHKLLHILRFRRQACKEEAPRFLRILRILWNPCSSRLMRFSGLVVCLHSPDWSLNSQTRRTTGLLVREHDCIAECCCCVFHFVASFKPLEVSHVYSMCSC